MTLGDGKKPLNYGRKYRIPHTITWWLKHFRSEATILVMIPVALFIGLIIGFTWRW